MPVLTEHAAHIAAERAERQNFAPRVKMVKRFFLNRVNCKSCVVPVRRHNNVSADILSNLAESALPFF